MSKSLTFIDLFAGIGGLRIGFEQACNDCGIAVNCVLTSEIKKSAIKVYKDNFKEEEVEGDIKEIDPKNIPNFDVLLAGFPCQPFSSAGSRKGLLDDRGSLFFDILKIIRNKSPKLFLLENVEGLEKHNGGKTLKFMLGELEKLNYNVSYNIIDSLNYDVPQKRIRVYIYGHRSKKVIYQPKINSKIRPVSNFLSKGLPTLESSMIKKLLKFYTPEQLKGKSIKDKRGGINNIHSWDIELKGSVNKEQKKLLNQLLKERRKKKWAEIKKIDWMDGMPLTLNEISTFSKIEKQVLKEYLDDLVEKKYIVYEYPKKQVLVKGIKTRVYDETKEKGYNIVTGKLSFEINKILDDGDISPTIVATDATRLAVVDGNGIRFLDQDEALRFFGFPKHFKLNVPRKEAFDLLGNTVVVPVIRDLSGKLIAAC